LQRWIKEGRVSAAGVVLSKVSRKLSLGTELQVREPAPLPPPAPLRPEDIPVPLIYQDEHILIIDKPSGLTVHPGAGQRDGTLANALLAIGGPLSRVGGDERPGIVHRLDKDTSGVMVVARTDSAHRRLSAQFKERLTDKLYLALLKGDPPARITVDAPLGRSLRDRKRMAIRHDQGRHAVSHFEVRERFAPLAALVAVKIETGRTHQIRVHAQSLGHGIVSDPFYGRRHDADAAIERLGLHAHELSFNHPASGERVCFKAELPADMLAAIAALRAMTQGDS